MGFTASITFNSFTTKKKKKKHDKMSVCIFSKNVKSKLYHIYLYGRHKNKVTGLVFCKSLDHYLITVQISKYKSMGYGKYGSHKNLNQNIRSGRGCGRGRQGDNSSSSSELIIVGKCLPVSTTRPEKCDIFAQRYQSQPITTKFQKHCLYFLNLQKPCKNISLSEYFAKYFKCCIPYNSKY